MLLGRILSAWERVKLGTQDQEVLVELSVAFPCTAVTSVPALDPRPEGSLWIVDL